MLSTQTPETRAAAPSLPPSSPMEAGRQRQGRLWSNLKEVCDLLHISSACTIAADELLFQHVQFKTGQRVHTIGQPFDTLYIVNSGFLKTVSTHKTRIMQKMGMSSLSEMVQYAVAHRLLSPFKT